MPLISFHDFQGYLRRVIPGLRWISLLTPTHIDDDAVDVLQALANAPSVDGIDWSTIKTIFAAALPLLDGLMSLPFVPAAVRTVWAIVRQVFSMANPAEAFTG